MKYLHLIKDYYRDKRAKRSGVPYINHIIEGLDILSWIGAANNTKEAYALHPIFQEDATLSNNLFYYTKVVDARIVALCMEYRNVANRGLSCYQVDNPDKIYLSPLPQVNEMLIADKVQNRKDFLTYHYGKHPKSIELDIYFKNWLRALQVTEAMYNELCKVIERNKNLREF